MSSISSDEIISILKNEIENFDQISKDSEVGTVVSVGDGIANIYGICLLYTSDAADDS